RPIPVSGSGVMFGTTARMSPGGMFDRTVRISFRGITRPPASSTPGIICPFGPRELWHTPDANGSGMIQMASVFGEQERSMLRARVLAGLERVRQQGTKLGRPKVSPKVENAIRN